MKGLFTISIIFIYLNISAQTDTVLAAKIDSMAQLDQEWRVNSRMLKNGKIDSLQYLETRKRIGGYIDTLNHPILENIFHKYGYPGYNLVGKKSSHNFWLLIQHQDWYPDFQVKVLEKMKLEANNNNASILDYAYLIDRVKVNSNQLQIYGTQMKLNENNTSYEPKPVTNPDELNKRRIEIGLSTIEEYIDVMNKHYHGDLKKEAKPTSPSPKH